MTGRTDPLLDAQHALLVALGDEADRDAPAARARRAADAVRVLLGAGGDVPVEDERDVRDVEPARAADFPVIAALEDTEELAPPRALHGDEPIVAPLRVDVREGMVAFVQSTTLALLEAVEDHLREPEGMPDVHARSAASDAEVLDGWVVGCVRVEDGVEVGGSEVRVCRGIEKREEERSER